MPDQLDHTSEQPLDLIEELRLRRWARRNYVPAGGRAGAWHPVVLDEMRIKDRELVAVVSVPLDAEDEIGELSTNRRICSRYVPLPPTQVNVVHDGHDLPGEPNRHHAAERRIAESWH